jgi:hypothetical protein
VSDRRRRRTVRPSSGRWVEPGRWPRGVGARSVGVSCGNRTKEADAPGRPRPRVRLRIVSGAMSCDVSFSAGDVSPGAPSSLADPDTKSKPAGRTAGAGATSIRMSQASRQARPDEGVHPKAHTSSTSMPPRQTRVERREKPAETCSNYHTRPAPTRLGGLAAERRA